MMHLTNITEYSCAERGFGPSRKKMRVAGSIVLTLLTLIPWPGAMAGDNEQRDLPAASSQLQSKEVELLEMRKAIVRDTLQLEPDIAKRFWPLYDDYQKQLVELRLKRRELLTDLGEGVDGMSEAEAKEYVKDKLEYEEQRLSIGRAYFKKLAEFMSYRSLATYLQVETKIKTYIEAGIEESIPLIR
jgi:hypothetical protein